MSKIDLTEKTLNSKRVMDGKLLKINVDEVQLPDGSKTTREYVVHPGAVMMIPLLPDGRVAVSYTHLTLPTKRIV